MDHRWEMYSTKLSSHSVLRHIHTRIHWTMDPFVAEIQAWVTLGFFTNLIYLELNLYGMCCK